MRSADFERNWDSDMINDGSKAAHSSEWAMPLGALAELDARLDVLRPRRILELGSGDSTVTFARYAKRCHDRGERVDVVALESSTRFLDDTTSRLENACLRAYAEVRHAPLSEPLQRHGGARMYETSSLYGEQLFDFALIDGPTLASGGRAATYPSIRPYLTDRAEIWLDDAQRKSELAALRRWGVEGIGGRAVDIGHGLFVIPGDGVPVYGHRVDASNVIITMVTGGRPDMLQRTLRNLTTRAPGLLDSARFIVLHNGVLDLDQTVRATFEVLGDYEDKIDSFIDVACGPGGILGPGAAYAYLASCVNQCATPNDTWLHIEDDWSLEGLSTGWLEAAEDILRNHSSIGSVRFRHVSEPTLRRNMLTGEPIEWRPFGPNFEVATSAHWTFNPALTRVEMARHLKGVRSEHEAQTAVARLGAERTARHTPGVFVHAGQESSLRLETKLP